jgi:hypothetical protein
LAAGKKPSFNSDCILSALGYGTIVVPIISYDIGPNIIATEDQGRDNRIFYPMQVQLDTFSISAVFASKAGTNFFMGWLRQYIDYASAPGSNIALGMRVRVPIRNFDMRGFPVSGWSYTNAPLSLEDVTWVITVGFDGAAPNVPSAWAPPSSAYGAAPTPASPSQKGFYPAYYDSSGNAGGGPPTGSDAEYNTKKGIKHHKKPVPKPPPAAGHTGVTGA